MDSAGAWTLSPAYDNVYTSQKPTWFSRGHQITIGGKALDITRKDLLTVAHTFDIAAPAAIIDQVREGISQWESLAGEFGIRQHFPDYANAVSAGLKAVDTP